MSHKAALLLNLAILVTGFVVALGVTESQVGVLRTTARVAYAAPPAIARPQPERVSAPTPAHAGAVPRARLLKYLGRLEGLERLTSEQVVALLACHDHCRGELSEEGARLWAGALDGARVRQRLGDVEARMRRTIETRLRAAGLPEGPLLSMLVRIVVSSTG